MYSLSTDATVALKADHVLELAVEAYAPGGTQLMATTDAATADVGKLRVDKSSGQIQCDRNADFVRNFQATVIDLNGVLVPGTNPAIDPLYRPWIRIYWDIIWPTSTGMASYRVPAGTFAIEKCNSHEYHGGAIHEMSGNDIGVLISQNPFTQAFDIGGTGIKYHAAIATLLTDRAAGFTPRLSLEPSATDCPAATLSNNDSMNPWEHAKKLAEADGKELFVGQAGDFVMRTVPDPTSTGSCWAYDQSSSSMRLDGDTMARDIDTANLYNGVILKATAPWLLYEIIGTAWDTDPNSATYYKGPFGQRPKQIENNLVADQTSADAAAAAELKKVLGVQEEVKFEAVVNPAHELGDVVTIGSRVLGVQENVLLQSFTLPFDVKASMTGSCRRQRKGANVYGEMTHGS